MINVRQVANITKDGSVYTLVDVKIMAENVEGEKRVTAHKGVNAGFTDVSSLFTAIRDNVVALIQSGLV